MKNVLILGSGMIAAPIVKYILGYGFSLTIASNTVERAKKLINNNAHGKAIFLDVSDKNKLEQEISEHDIVVCLLPQKFYYEIANLCIKHKKNMVTTLPLDANVEELDKKAKKADVIILNECGFSPGIDHMSAMRVINTIHGLGGKVLEFYSICGALPVAEVSKSNPFRYKFSWSPQTVLEAMNNDAEYLKNGKIVKLSSEKVLSHSFKIDFPSIESLEVFANSTSIPYIDLYNIPKVKTMYRGTFRYSDWCETINALNKIGFTNTDKKVLKQNTLADITASLIGINNKKELKKELASYLKKDIHSVAIKGIEFLGLLSDKVLEKTYHSLFELLSELMIDKMMLQPDEKDMCVMQHTFLARYPDGKKEVVRSRLVDFGSPDDFTSIARTVAFPVATAVRLILENEITVKGLHIPLIPEIYNPILSDLEVLDLEFVEEFGLPVSKNIQLP